MKVLFVLIAAGALSLTDSARAQTPPPALPQQHLAPGRTAAGEALLHVLLTDITLVPEQQAKIDTIRARGWRQLPAMTPGAAVDSSARLQIRDVVIQMHDQIRAVLTAEQQKLWDRNVAEVRAVMAAKLKASDQHE